MDYIDYGVGIPRRASHSRKFPTTALRSAELYTRMVDEKAMMGYEVTNRFYEIGTPASLEEARQYLATHPQSSS
jgi:NDP-sugar pyrophosphorylase family protein